MSSIASPASDAQSSEHITHVSNVPGCVDPTQFPFKSAEIQRLGTPGVSVGNLLGKYGFDTFGIFTHFHPNGVSMNRSTRSLRAADLMRRNDVDSRVALMMVDADMNTNPEEIVTRMQSTVDNALRLLGKGVNKLQSVKRNGIMEDGPVVVPGGPQSIAKYVDQREVQMLLHSIHSSLHAEVLKRDIFEGAEHSACVELRSRIDTVFALYTELMTYPGISRIPSEAISDLLETCIGVTTRPDFNVVITVGYGGSDDPALLRTPSYIIPALEFLEIFKKYHAAGRIQSMPTLRIVQAVQLAHSVNTSLDTCLVDRFALDRDRILKQFVECFADTTVDGQPLSLVEQITFETDDAIDYLSMSQASDLFTRTELDEHHQNFLDRVMLARAGKRVDGDVSYRLLAAQRYIAAHLAVFLDVVDPKRRGYTPDVAISFGSQGGEVPFNHFRSGLAKAFDTSYRPLSIRFGQKVGDHPPYYQQTERSTVIPQDVTMAGHEAISVSEFAKPHGPKQKAVTHDLKMQWEFIRQRCKRRGMSDKQAEVAYRAFCQQCL